MVDFDSVISIIMFNVQELITPFNGQTGEKAKPNYMLFIRHEYKGKDTLKAKGYQKMYL